MAAGSECNSCMAVQHGGAWQRDVMEAFERGGAWSRSRGCRNRDHDGAIKI